MASFIGDYTCKADSKCRVVVPASFRRVMVASQQTFFVLRKNVFGKCIDMYPLQEWENMIAGVRARLNFCLLYTSYISLCRTPKSKSITIITDRIIYAKLNKRIIIFAFKDINGNRF